LNSRWFLDDNDADEDNIVPGEKPAGEIEESGGSESDYKPSDAGDEDEGDVEEVEFEADEQQSMPVARKVKEKKKEKPGIITRREIRLIQDQQSKTAVKHDHAHALLKRKSSNLHT
jgi:hypothetical protein